MTQREIKAELSPVTSDHTVDVVVRTKPETEGDPVKTLVKITLTYKSGPRPDRDQEKTSD